MGLVPRHVQENIIGKGRHVAVQTNQRLVGENEQQKRRKELPLEDEDAKMHIQIVEIL